MTYIELYGPVYI